MALVTYGTLVTNIKGTLGGVMYTRGHAGPVIRTPTSKPWVDSPRRMAIRDALEGAHSYWAASLTAANRASWEDYAAATPLPGRMGRPIQLTGYNMFARSLSLRAWFGGTPVLTTPSMPGLPAPLNIYEFKAFATTDIFRWRITNDALRTPGVNSLVFVTVSKLHSPTRMTEQYPSNMCWEVLEPTEFGQLPLANVGYNPWGTWPDAVGSTVYCRVKTLYPDNRLTTSQLFRVALEAP